MTIASLLPHYRSRESIPPSGPAYDVVRVIISRTVAEDEELFHATLERPGVGMLGGPFRQREAFQFSQVCELRRAYEQRLRLQRELEACGLPTPSLDRYDLRALIDLGRRVAEILPQTVRQSIIAAIQRSRQRRRALRLILEVARDAKYLLGVPWELMVLPLVRGAQAEHDDEGFVLLNADVTLIRQVQSIGCNVVPRLARPLRLQAFAATPTDGQPIDLGATRASIASVLPDQPIPCWWYADADTLGELQRRLQANNPQIVHILCHGERQDIGNRGRNSLLFTHRDGYIQRVSAFDLAPIFSLAGDVQLIVLQACHAGDAIPNLENRPNGADADRERLAVESIALELIRQCAPAVIAMQGAVDQASSEAFIRALYHTFAQGQSLEQAVAAGRIAMRAAGGLVDWSMPVLYQGSGFAEPEPWYGRLADSVFERCVYHASAQRTGRGGIATIALVLLAVGMVRWLLLPTPEPLHRETLLRVWVLWAELGLIGPAIIAAAYRGVRNRADLSAGVRRAARYAQWIGAYLGYVLSGLVGFTALAAIWLIGAFAFMSTMAALTLFAGMLLGGLFASYAAARAQVRSALAIAPLQPELFSPGTLTLALVAAAALAAAPYGVVFLLDTPWAFLLDPGPGAFTLALLLLTLALLWE